MEYITSFSGGKDSTATIILAHEHNEPMDLIIFSEVMFDELKSGELPEHIDFVKNKAIPLFKSWGYTTEVLHAKDTYMDCFNHIITKSKHPERNGKRNGFPMAGRCIINDRCKIKPIKDFFKTKDATQITQYIGIAADEPERLQRMRGKVPTQISLLEKYGYTEEMAFDICEKYGLLSPVYEFSPRGGCWFCPNARDCELKHLRAAHPDLWQTLLELEKEPGLIGEIWNTLRKQSITEKDRKFHWEDAQMTIFDYIED